MMGVERDKKEEEISFSKHEERQKNMIEQHAF